MNSRVQQQRIRNEGVTHSEHGAVIAKQSTGEVILKVLVRQTREGRG
jgi:hypothetical protein